MVSNPKSKKGNILVHQVRSLLVESVVRRFMVSAFYGRTITFDVARVVTRLEIALKNSEAKRLSGTQYLVK